MSKLLKDLKNLVKDEKYGKTHVPVMASSGFDVFDYQNGNAVTIDGKEVHNIGLDYGKIVTVVGRTGSGKSTLAIQMAWSLIKDFENGNFIIMDFEGSNTENRIRAVTGMTQEEFSDRVEIKSVGISTETVYEIIKQFRDFKMKKDIRKILEVDSPHGALDENGKPLKVMTPTVILIDSVAMMTPREYMGGDQMAHNMVGNHAAKVNTRLFKDIVQPCLEANIIPIFINHITDDINTGITPKAAMTNYLKQGESLPGGKAPVYLTNTLIKVTPSTKLDESKLYKIKGFEAKVELIKSRTAPAGITSTMVFDQVEGFNNLLTNLTFLKENKVVEGGAWLTLADTGHKFQNGAFVEMYNTNEEFRSEFDRLVKETLVSSLRSSSRAKEAEVAEEEQEDFIEDEE